MRPCSQLAKPAIASSKARNTVLAPERSTKCINNVGFAHPAGSTLTANIAEKAVVPVLFNSVVIAAMANQVEEDRAVQTTTPSRVHVRNVKLWVCTMCKA